MSNPMYRPRVKGEMQEASDPAVSAGQPGPDTSRDDSRTPLADLVAAHLRSRGLRQIDFCRQTGFDQGLLSKILSSVVSTLNVESALKLAEGMNVPPLVVFEAIGKKELDQMLRRVYAGRSV
ncbi:MAG TPA: helix-turn-helix domain-containing protein [Blastocatellia bacterium]|nr:helix-turn-helix domain-containing protein [Blastocatellia bacterium]